MNNESRRARIKLELMEKEGSLQLLNDMFDVIHSFNYCTPFEMIITHLKNQYKNKLITNNVKQGELYENMDDKKR